MFHRLYYSTTLKHDISQNCKPPTPNPTTLRAEPTRSRAQSEASARGTNPRPSERHPSQQGAQRSVRARETACRKRNPLAAGRAAKRPRPWHTPRPGGRNPLAAGRTAKRLRPWKRPQPDQRFTTTGTLHAYYAVKRNFPARYTPEGGAVGLKGHCENKQKRATFGMPRRGREAKPHATPRGIPNSAQ